MDYTDFLTRLFKKTGGKYFHIILDTIASKVFMPDGTTVESSIESTRTQAATAIYAANAAQNIANSAYNKAQTAQETAELKIDKSTAASELAGNGMTAENGKLNVDDTIIDNNEELSAKLAVLEKLAMQNFAPNDEIWITESGDWEVPYNVVYEITLIDGGDGGVVYKNNSALGGNSGLYKTFFKKLSQGEIIHIVIGAGGTGYAIASGSAEDVNLRKGGKTIFGDLDTGSQDPTCFRVAGNINSFSNNSDSHNTLRSSGGGYAPLYPIDTGYDGIGYGSGGSAILFYNNSVYVGNGKQGAVYMRFFNPTKASLPTINDTDLIPYTNFLQRLEAIEAQLNINS